MNSTYRIRRVDGKRAYEHRLIAGAKPGQIVDHINGDKKDNRPENLRVVDRCASNQNRGARKDSTAPFKGITREKRSGRWRAQIMANKKYRTIGTYATAEEAARAYDEAAVRLHGPFARTNGFVTYNERGA